MHRLVFDEVAEMRILVVADRRLHRDRLLGDLQHLAHLVFRHLHALGQLVGQRLAAHLLQHLPRDTVELVDRLDHVHRNTNRARLIGDRARDGLANPPGGIGRKLVTAAVFEFVDSLHQTDVAFLDQVQELQAAVRVFLRDRNDEAQVGFDHLFLRAAGFGLADRHLAVDFLDLADLEAGHFFDGDQLALRAQNVVLQLGENRRVLALGANMLVNPLEIGFALRESSRGSPCAACPHRARKAA